jgi:RNA polymerase sigma factor (sigma-70 family)
VIESSPSQGRGEDPLAVFLNTQAGQLGRYIAQRVRGDAQAVRDLWQETITQLVAYHEKHGALPPLPGAVGLLYRIAHCRIVDYYDRGRRTDLPVSDEELLARAAACAEVLDEAVTRRVDLAQALKRLTPPQVRALTLVYIDDMEYARAAEVMGISVNGVKAHLSSAKTRARRLFELTGYGIDPTSGEGGTQ